MRHMIGAAGALIALALIGAWGCGSDGSHSPPAGKNTEPSQFYFDVTYANQAWGYVLNGWFVDDQGDLYRFDHGAQRWTPAETDGDTLAVADLMEKYSLERQLLRRVDGAELARMRSFLDGAAEGKVTDPIATGCADFGAITYQGWLLLADHSAYVRVLLHQKGDLGRINEAPAADTLRAWLDGLTGLNPQGCEPQEHHTR